MTAKRYAPLLATVLNAALEPIIVSVDGIRGRRVRKTLATLLDSEIDGLGVLQSTRDEFANLDALNVAFLQSGIRRLIESLVDSATVPSPKEVLIGHLVFTPTVNRDSGIRLMIDGPAPDVFRFLFLLLLSRLGLPKLHRCKDPKCARLFVKVTVRKYCSTRCQKRIYMRWFNSPHFKRSRKAKRHGKTRKG